MEEVLLSIESHLIQSLKWPSWALRLIASLVALVIGTAVLEQVVTATTSNSEKNKKKNDEDKATNTSKATSSSKMTWAFRWFQLQYLSVYLLTMLADWLQGTNMYTLYSVSFESSFLSFFTTHLPILTVIYSFLYSHT
jgi:L-lactate permease